MGAKSKSLHAEVRGLVFGQCWVWEPFQAAWSFLIGAPRSDVNSSITASPHHRWCSWHAAPGKASPQSGSEGSRAQLLRVATSPVSRSSGFKHVNEIQTWIWMNHLRMEVGSTAYKRHVLTSGKECLTCRGVVRDIRSVWIWDAVCATFCWVLEMGSFPSLSLSEFPYVSMPSAKVGIV